MDTPDGIRAWGAQIVDRCHPAAPGLCALFLSPLHLAANGPTAPLSAAAWLAVVWAELTLLLAVLQWLVLFSVATYVRPLLAGRRRSRLRGVAAALFGR